MPDEAKSLRGGAVRPWQTESYRECQDDLVRFARKRGVPLDTPWRELSAQHRKWVLEGEGSWEDKVWYGVRRFFAWLETKAYKMHIRVLLSKYRAYTPCTACDGARLKTDALLWRLGTRCGSASRARTRAASDCNALPVLSVHELMLLPIERCAVFFERLALPAPLDEASDLVLREIRSRLKFLLDVGLGYLTLDRQSRTLSGGEVQRINLTTALGTSLVNTLFVLDEPSIGLHPRDMGRVIGVMKRLKQCGQFAGRRRARSAGHAGGGSHSRRRTGPGREGRRDRVLRSPGAAGRRAAFADCGLSAGTEAGEWARSAERLAR